MKKGRPDWIDAALLLAVIGNFILMLFSAYVVENVNMTVISATALLVAWIALVGRRK